MRLTSGWKAAMASTLIALGSSALSHATFVLGTLQSNPATPQKSEPFTLLLELEDPTGIPIEDAWVLAEFRPQDALKESNPTSFRFEEVNPGRYQSEVTLTENGNWQLLLRDQTYRQEEATAELVLTVGKHATGEDQLFVFPPTATNPPSVIAWLIWVVALPVAAGGIVTVIVLSHSGNEREYSA